MLKSCENPIAALDSFNVLRIFLDLYLLFRGSWAQGRIWYGSVGRVSWPLFSDTSPMVYPRGFMFSSEQGIWWHESSISQDEFYKKEKVMRLSDETGVQCTFPPCIPDGKMLFSCQGASLFNAKKHWRGLPSNDYNISHVVLFYRGMQCYHARR